MNTLGQKIKALRKQHKLTQKAFGDLVGVSYAHISSIEAGKDYPSKVLLQNICSKFNVAESCLTDENCEDFIVRRNNIIKTNITELMEEHNMSREDFIKKIGISPPDYFLIELGNPNIDISTLIKVADYFSVSLDWLVRGKEHNIYYSPDLSIEEVNLLNEYKQLDGDEKTIFRSLLTKLIYKNKFAN